MSGSPSRPPTSGRRSTVSHHVGAGRAVESGGTKAIDDMIVLRSRHLSETGL
jgi:hypothetical protein